MLKKWFADYKNQWNYNIVENIKCLQTYIVYDMSSDLISIKKNRHTAFLNHIAI